MKKTLKALVAVRSGSQRVQDKNIRQFANSNLLEIKIKQLLKIKQLDGIVINSNDDIILSLASRFEVSINKRDEKFASNTISMSEVYRNMAENIDADYILYANVTNPLIKTETIQKIIDFFYANIDVYDSVNSATKITEFLFLDNKPINYDLLNQPRSQDLPPINSLNFAVNIISRQNMIDYKNVVGRNPYLFDISDIEGIDIDNQLDFDIAEFLYQRNK
jgi:CMP-N,N'-diacetyllegionaminic acid synthase